MWYLSEELVSLSLFDKKIENETRNEMAKILRKSLKTTRKGNISIEKNRSARAEIEDLNDIPNLDLLYFFGKKSIEFFKHLDLIEYLSFLKEDVKNWDFNTDYIICRKKLKNLKVCNDFAERCVKLTSDYTLLFTKKEEEKQNILLGVADNRKKIKKITKKNIIKNLD